MGLLLERIKLKKYDVKRNLWFEPRYHLRRFRDFSKVCEPTFIIVGAQKAATTTLFQRIASCDGFGVPLDKETHFFDRKRHSKNKDYYRCFPTLKNDMFSGEATPFYSLVPNIHRRISEMFPEMKIVLIIRNPIDRAISHYYMEFVRGRERRKISDAIIPFELHKEYQRRWPNISKKELIAWEVNSYIERGMYSGQIESLYENFQKEQIHIIVFERFIKYEREELAKVSQFLGRKIPDTVSLTAKNVNRSRRVDVSEEESEMREKLKRIFRNDIDRLQSVIEDRITKQYISEYWC